MMSAIILKKSKKFWKKLDQFIIFLSSKFRKTTSSLWNKKFKHANYARFGSKGTVLLKFMNSKMIRKISNLLKKQLFEVYLQLTENVYIYSLSVSTPSLKWIESIGFTNRLQSQSRSFAKCKYLKIDGRSKNTTKTSW
jgi:hypothetical protein